MKVHLVVFCPQLLGNLSFFAVCSITQNMLAFNKGTSQPLGILPKFPISLGGKTIYVDVMVVEDPLDFKLFLGMTISMSWDLLSLHSFM